MSETMVTLEWRKIEALRDSPLQKSRESWETGALVLKVYVLENQPHCRLHALLVERH